jgi:hypothetical protein
LEWSGQVGVEIDLTLGSGEEALQLRAKSGAKLRLNWEQSARLAALK